jgi:uracil-DNA glycosylase family protein
MRVVRLQREHDFEEWRAVARALLLSVVQPDEVQWEVAGEAGDFFAAAEQIEPVNYRAVGLVPQRFVDLAKIALFHRDPRRFALLYRLLFRLQKHRGLLELRADPDVSRLYKLVSDLREEAEQKRNLPAAPEISPPKEMVAVKPQSDEAKAEIVSLADARAAVQGCRRCPLYEHATQAVFGEGPQNAEVMFVGEQPGDQEDLAGKPFVGPAGQLFDKALEKIGIDRRRVYVTNAVKHFKFEPRGKKRIHSKPNAGEIQACRFWVNLEREFVRPKLVVALGATAVTSLMGKAASITSLRGKKIELPDGGTLLVTVHPSYLLRMPDRDKAAEEMKRFGADLGAVKAFIDRRGDDVRVPALRPTGPERVRSASR